MSQAFLITKKALRLYEFYIGKGKGTTASLIWPTIVSWEKLLQILWEGLVEKVLSLDERFADRGVLEFHKEKVAAHLMPVALQGHRAVLG